MSNTLVDVNSIASDLDQVLVRCRGGDAAAQRELYERYHRRVYCLAARVVSHAEAADITQDIFLRVFRGLDSFQGGACFSTWLYRVAINECLRFSRRARPVTRGLSSDPVSREAKPGQRLEEAEALAHALECLDPMLRIVFLLRHSEGMGYKRISAILGIPISTAATRLNRARETLQQLLKGERQGS